MRTWWLMLLVGCSTPRTIVPDPAPKPIPSSPAASPLASFLDRLDATGYGPLRLDAPLPATLATDLSHVEWHGNHVGERWMQARVTCATCSLYQFGPVDLFDNKVARFDVWTTIPRSDTGSALDVCDALGKQLGAEACRCGEASWENELARWAMPMGPHAAPPCVPAKESSTRFIGAGGARGVLAVHDKEIVVTVTLRGAAWKTFLDANDE